MNSRIYGKKVNIDTCSTADFYNHRARTIDERQQEYTTVLLGDQNPDYALKWDEFEKKKILPKLNISKKKNVLDLGCGIGRWADTLSEKCNLYYGVDFSAEMIEIAKKRHNPENCFFYNMSVRDALVTEEIIRNKFDIIIITGVSMYINDDELRECYNNLFDVLSDDALVYIEESVGKRERLTLNHIWSENLNSYYEAIYRTREEYIELLDSMINRCDVIEDGFMDELDKDDMSETSHWYVLIHKGELD